MRIATTIVGVVVTAALIAGGSSFTATAAEGEPRISTDGLSEISLPPALIETLAEAGVTLKASGGGKVSVDGSTGYTNLSFPSTKSSKVGDITHRGVLEIESSVTQVLLKLTNPTIVDDTELPGTGTLGGILTGLPEWMEPYSSALNDTYRAPFELTNMKTTVKKGKVTKKGKSYIRKDLVSVTALMSFIDSVDSANIFNTALEGPGGALFTPGQALGNISSKYSVTTTCKTMKACKG